MKVQLLLQAIDYSGNNIGKDFTITFRVFGKDRLIDSKQLNLIYNSERTFDPNISLGETNADESKSRFQLKINVEEKGVKERVADTKEQSFYLAYLLSDNQPVTHERIMEVEELGTLDRAGEKAILRFTFVLLLKEDSPQMKLPVLAAPIVRNTFASFGNSLILFNSNQTCIYICTSEECLIECF